MNVLYEVQKWQVWKGINPNKPTWHGINLVCETREAAQELSDYVERNSNLPHRVMPRTYE